jgi:hypothetical protein
MSGRQKRKRRRRGQRGPHGKPAAAVGGSESADAGGARSKDDRARDELEPLGEGERPRAVTIGAVIAAALAISNVVLYAAGAEPGGTRPTAAGTFLFAALLLVMAAGMWYARYWAVLGFEALLAVLIIVMSLLLVRAENLVSFLFAASIIAASGTLFWFLVKSLARIQMPERRPPGT